MQISDRAMGARGNAARRPVGFLVTALLFFASLATANPEALQQKQRELAGSKVRLQLIQKSARQLRLDANTLSTQISNLKATGKNSAKLGALLERSVATTQQLESALLNLKKEQRVYRTQVRSTIRVLDKEIRAQVPKLKQGTKLARKLAAQGIQELRKLRRSYARELGQKKNADQNKSWSDYDVRIDPLDGPQELREKADFVEDTRDKIVKKQRMLLALLESAKEERRVTRAAKEFARDTYLFDEESRAGRILRRTGQPQASATVQNDTSQEESANPGQNQGDGFSQPVEQSAPPPGNESPSQAPQEDTALDPVADTPSPTTPLAGTPQGAITNPDTGRSGTASTFEPAAISKDVNATILINLQVGALAGRQLDVQTLNRLIKELEALSKTLDAKAGTIRRRAQELERKKE